MSGHRVSVSDYPEHLNPFYNGKKFRFWNSGNVKRSNSIKETLRDVLTLKSFRRKSKTKEQTAQSPSSPELRRHESISIHHRQTFPTSITYLNDGHNMVPLPRSRFSERVKNDSIVSEGSSNHDASSSTTKQLSGNLFKEEEKQEVVVELKPKRLRRKKKRAPLPPNMSKEEAAAFVGMSSSHNLSKWSLTSVETNTSVLSDYDHDSVLMDNNLNKELSVIMLTITQEIGKLNDDIDDKSLNDKNVDVPPDIVSSSMKLENSSTLVNSCDNSPECLHSSFETADTCNISLPSDVIYNDRNAAIPENVNRSYNTTNDELIQEERNQQKTDSANAVTVDCNDLNNVVCHNNKDTVAQEVASSNCDEIKNFDSENKSTEDCDDLNDLSYNNKEVIPPKDLRSGYKEIVGETKTDLENGIIEDCNIPIAMHNTD